jgi:hypothetical protein
LEKESTWLASQGQSWRVIAAYQQVLPLLVEHAAISRYMEQTEAYDLRAALPEVTSVAEAVELMTMEYSLTGTERQELRQLLAKSVRQLLQRS